MVQWLRLCTPSTEGLGVIPDQGTGSHVPQWRLKSPCATAKTRHSQINKSIQQKRLPIPVLLFVKSINVSVYSSPVACLYKLSFFFCLKNCLSYGLPWQLSGKESACQCRRYRVQSLVWEDPTCCGAAKPTLHNYWACALEPRNRNSRAHVLQLLKPEHPGARALQQEKPPQWKALSLQQRVAPACCS